MGSVSSDDGLDQLSERFESYSLSADVSESESSSCDSSLRYITESAVSSSLTPSSLIGPKLAVTYRFPALPLKISSPFMAEKLEKPNTDISEVELMKERFAKLLLGEDMSGGGNGVCTALAISNAITNLSATVFGELWKLEPLAPQKKAMWCREMDWILSVSNSIVELIPSFQEFPGGGTFEVMVPRPRLDLYVNLPALKKLDAMLLSLLDGFESADFHYIDRGVIVSGADEVEQNPLSSSCGRTSIRLEEKWWLPFPKVPPNGLSDEVRKRLQQCRVCTNQIHKAAMAINNNVLAEMEIPIVYLDSLPKSGKACLGEIIYSYMTANQFSSEYLLDYLDLSSEYTTLEIANRIEAAAHIWRKKCLKKHLLHANAGRSSWGGKVKGLVGDTDKNKLLAQRAETLLHNLRLRFPGLPQTALDTNKIEYNKDVGQSILESYSRVMESLAFNVMARIDDLLYVDDATKQRATAESISLFDRGNFGGALPVQKPIYPSPFTVQQAAYDLPFTTPAAYSSNLIIGSRGKTRSYTNQSYPNTPLSGN